MLKLRKDKVGMTAAILLLLICLIAILAPYLPLKDPYQTNLEKLLLPPSNEHPFGTDELGRDVLSRVVWGARYSLMLSITTIVVALIVGVPLGIVAAYYGGILDTVIMRIIDMILCIPTFLIAVLILVASGPGLNNVILAMAVYTAPMFARVVRASVLPLREKEFVKAAVAMGCSNTHIIIFHLVPPILGSIVVLATLRTATVILTAATLSFLGLGIMPPTPEWGSMMNTARYYFLGAPNLMIFPGLAIAATVLILNIFGDSLRDAIDPTIRVQN